MASSWRWNAVGPRRTEAGCVAGLDSLLWGLRGRMVPGSWGADRKWVELEWLSVWPTAASWRWTAEIPEASPLTPWVIGLRDQDEGAVARLRPASQFFAVIADIDDGVVSPGSHPGRRHGLKPTGGRTAELNDVHAGVHGQAKMGS